MIRLAEKLVLASLRLYQVAISPLIQAECRFHPTCSEYAIGCVGRLGIGRGLVLAVWRLVRCQPYAKGGFDPVPETWSRVISPWKKEHC